MLRSHPDHRQRFRDRNVVGSAHGVGKLRVAQLQVRRLDMRHRCPVPLPAFGERVADGEEHAFPGRIIDAPVFVWGLLESDNVSVNPVWQLDVSAVFPDASERRVINRDDVVVVVGFVRAPADENAAEPVVCVSLIAHEIEAREGFDTHISRQAGVLIRGSRIVSRRAVRPITVISGSQLNADSLRQPWVMAGLGFLRGGKLNAAVPADGRPRPNEAQ
jgi:hypothetical protein